LAPIKAEQQSLGDGRPREFFIPNLCAPRPVFIMVLLSELLVLLHVLLRSDLPAFNWDLLASTSLFVQLIVLSSDALLCLLRGVFSRLTPALATIASLGVVLFVTLLASFSALRIPVLPAAGEPQTWWVLRNALVALVLAGIVLRYFYLQHQLRRQEQSELRARLEALRARIRPHFLFNTMNSIVSLIASRPEDAERVVEDLSELFRASLQESADGATVADELHLCDTYLRIERVRLGERLQVEREIDAAALEHPMPSLILQPLVENAIYHGISRLTGGGIISLRIQVVDGRLCAEVRNPLPVDATSRVTGHQMAVANIEERLQGLFGENASLRSELEGGEYRVRLEYPLGEGAG
jgi:two-component system sensor histidine kinase AlgZ